MPTTIVGAVPYAVTKDDEYMGYLISHGAGVLSNVCTIHHDPNRFSDPRRFDPDRYKDDRQPLHKAASNPDASKRDTLTFGAGRRICAGMHVAERSLLLGVSRIPWSFDIRPAVDPTTGKVLMPDPEKLKQGFFACLSHIMLP